MTSPNETATAAAFTMPEPLNFRSVDRRSKDLGPRDGLERRVNGVDRRVLPLSLGAQDRRDQPNLTSEEQPAEIVSAAQQAILLQAQQSAHEQGVQEGMARAEAQLNERVTEERQGMARALEEFVRERHRYFAGLEKEVVRLSLAIAERVLHRESSMDPTLLAGAARVALQQVEDDSTAVLRTSPEEVALWEGIVEREGRSVKVCADANLHRGQCLLEAHNGCVELGVRSHLAEIEHGFFELLERNPAMSMQV